MNSSAKAALKVGRDDTQDVSSEINARKATDKQTYRPVHKQIRHKLLANFPLLAFILLLAIVWESLTRLLPIPHYIIPRLSAVLISLVDHAPVLAKHFVITLNESIIGLMISVLLGSLCALLIDSIRIAQRTLYPVIIASQTIPIIALSPIMVMWFGYELWSKVAVVVLFTFFPITVNTIAGLRAADPDIGELMRSMGASKGDLFWKWKLPSAVPHFFTGLKMAATISVGGATLGEWLGSEAGLGMYTKRASNLLQGEAVFTGVLLLSAMGIMLFLTVQLIERIVKGERRY